MDGRRYLPAMKASDTLNRRQTTLETLRSSGALFHWHPAVVDAALDLAQAFHDLDSLVRDVEFLGAVRRLCMLIPSLAKSIGEDAGTALRTPKLAMERPFLEGIRRKVEARMKLVVSANRVLADEIQERVRFEYLRMISRYLPGRITPDGSVRTYGFKALLETQLPYKVRDVIRRCVADFGHNDPDDHLDQQLTTSEHSIGITDSTAEIVRALKKAIRSPREAELLKAFISEDGALAEFAERYGTSAAKIRRGIEAIFARAAMELAEEGKAIGAPRLLHCRTALQDLMSAIDHRSVLKDRAKACLNL
jgi:hypothetical protein